MRSIVRFFEQEVPVIRGAIRDIPDYIKNNPPVKNGSGTISNMSGQGIVDSLKKTSVRSS